MNEIEMISGQPQLEIIQEKHGIDKERFVRGVIFSEYIVNGENSNNAYMLAFECTNREASTKSSNLRNSKWIQELIVYFRPDENTLYFGEIRAIIRKLMKIVDGEYSEDKDVIAASNALAKYVKVNVSKNEETNSSMTDAGKMIAGLMEGIADLASKDKMINKYGEIIDVPILE